MTRLSNWALLIFRFSAVLGVALLMVVPLHSSSAHGIAADTLTGHFEKVILSEDVTFPMELDIAHDGRVFYIERDGALKIWDPETGQTLMAGFIPVTTKIEDGLLGLALDPQFDENQWIYLYYSPLDEGPNTLSRFTMKGNELDMKSEIVMLEVPVQRLRCCHSAGSIEFGGDGLLYLSTGENSGGWNRIGERIEGLYWWDAYWDNERSTANTNDLRGKILRIRPEPDGSYTIPSGNLFEDDDSRTRPEIYTMGHRNPWRITVDAETGWVYWGDVGPGNQPDSASAPDGWEEMNQAKGPGFFGWPQFVGPNDAYRDRDPETDELLEWADPEHPINDSPHNTGIQELPPAQGAWIWYMYGPSETFPELGVGGMSAAVGPVYHYDAETVDPHGLPEHFDERVFVYEFMRHWVMDVRLDADGNPAELTPFAPEFTNIRPIDLELGPDARLYMLEWGTEFWGQNRDAVLVRYDYYESGDAEGAASASGAEGTASRPNADPQRASRNESTTASTTGPEITWPPHGGFFDYGQGLIYEMSFGGAEASLQPYLAHDTHRHVLKPVDGRRGVVQILPDLSHAPYLVAEFAELEARFAGEGSVTSPSVRADGRVKLNPKLLQAENNTSSSKAELIVTANRQRPTFAEETEVYLEMSNGSWIAYDPVDLHGVDSLAIRFIPDADGSVEVRTNGVEGALLGEASFTRADNADGADDEPHYDWETVRIPVTDPGGTQSLFVVVRGPERGTVARLDRIDVIGRGIMDGPPR
ncbi:MAG: PQQ-dependent sugar dehydrogenase [Rhodothermales bacterium]